MTVLAAMKVKPGFAYTRINNQPATKLGLSFRGKMRYQNGIRSHSTLVTTKRMRTIFALKRRAKRQDHY
jgi:hypothetical protein